MISVLKQTFKLGVVCCLPIIKGIAGRKFRVAVIEHQLCVISSSRVVFSAFEIKRFTKSFVPSFVRLIARNNMRFALLRFTSS